MTTLYVTISPLLYMWAFWCLYVFVMGIYRAHLDKRLTVFALVLASPVIVVAVVVDWLANWTIATIYFLEVPRTPVELVTGRLTGYISSRSDWRKYHAQVICRELLDYLDPSGVHCGSKDSGIQ